MADQKPQIIPPYLYKPDVVSSLTIDALRQERTAPDALKFGLPQMDDHYVMMRPRRVNGVLGFTSNGKTFLLNLLAKNFVPQLRPDEIVLYVTWEDSIEDLSTGFLANVSKIAIPRLWRGELTQQEWADVMRVSMERAATPLWLCGHSEYQNTRRPRLTMTDVWKAMEYITDVAKLKVRAVFFDYLQRVSRDDVKGEPRMQYMAIMDRIKDLSLEFNTCAIVASQVGRDVFERKNKQPQIADGQETSNFEHTCDGILSVWIPSKTDPIGQQIQKPTGELDVSITCTERLFMIETLKQKRGLAPQVRAFDYHPDLLELRPYTPPIGLAREAAGSSKSAAEERRRMRASNVEHEMREILRDEPPDYRQGELGGAS